MEGVTLPAGTYCTCELASQLLTERFPPGVGPGLVRSACRTGEIRSAYLLRVSSRRSIWLLSQAALLVWWERRGGHRRPPRAPAGEA